MTVSYFTALEMQIPATLAEQSMHLAQVGLYPHLTKEGAEKLWRSWADVLWRAEIEQQTPPAGGATFFWNGRAVAPAELRQKLGGALGSGLAA